MVEELGPREDSLDVLFEKFGIDVSLEELERVVEYGALNRERRISLDYSFGPFGFFSPYFFVDALDQLYRFFQKDVGR